MTPKTNMTARTFERWTDSEAFEEYAETRPSRKITKVANRTRRVLDGKAPDFEIKKLNSFVTRMKEVASGDPEHGSGPRAVSSRTASLRTWGFDPTGLYTP